MGSSCGADQEIVGECTELLAGLRADVKKLTEHSPGSETRARMHRLAHNAKGLVGFLGIKEMSDLAVGLEETLKSFVDDEQVTPTPQTVESIEERIVRLGGLIRAFGSSAEADEDDSLRPAFEALVASVGEVLTGFGVEGAESSEEVAADIPNEPGGLTVIAYLGDKVSASIVARFHASVVRPIAGKVATFIFGEELNASEGEREEFERGALGELVNYIGIATLTRLSLPPETGAPRFVTDGRTLVWPGSPALASVRTELGAFRIALVPGDPQLEDDHPAAPSANSSAPRGTVVVTDDSIVMRKNIERMLVRAGFEVVAQAKNGQEAVEQFRRHRPDLVTMDINMPVMSGLDALRIIRAEDPSARVLMCSAISESGVVRRGLDSGAVGHITKPFKPETLLEAVEYLMKERVAKSAPGRRDGATCPEIDALGIYRVEKLLGEGGMALVYRGHDPGLGRGVALKVIRDRYSGDVDLVVRFLEEARAVAQVSHPHVVSIYAAGSDQGKHYFAMELLPGPDLEELVYRKGPLTPRKAFAYIRQGAMGLAAAAEKGLIHCDVKPSNFVFGADGMVKVTDFGIAQKAGTEENPTISQMVGTPCFMSPEQVLEQPIDHRADIYALGTTLYYLLTGDPPYDGDDGVEVALRQVHDPVPQIAKAPRKLNRFLARMMAKSPEGRPATYDDLLHDIERLM